MSAGVLYAADMSVPRPKCHVRGGKFTPNLRACWWRRLGEIHEPMIKSGPVALALTNNDLTVPDPGDITLDFFANTKAGFKVNLLWGIPPTTGPRPKSVPLPHVRLMWESADKTRRVFFPRNAVGNISVFQTHAHSNMHISVTVIDIHEVYEAGRFARGGIVSAHVSSHLAGITGATASWKWNLTAVTASNLAALFNTPATTAAPTTAPVAAPVAKPAPARTGSISDLVPGRLIGYREWVCDGHDRGLTPSDVRLKSITASTVWPWTPSVTAVCHREKMGWNTRDNTIHHDPNEVPYPTCSCGIYSGYNPITEVPAGHVAGVIEAWGRIEVGNQAFRAQHARLVALCPTPSTYALFGNVHVGAGGYRMWRPLGEGTHVGGPSVAPAALDALAARYRVPVISLNEAIDRYPPTDISALLD